MRTIFLLLVLWLMMACGGSTAPQQQPPKGQLITLGGASDSTACCDTIRFGHLYEGEIAVKTVVLKNLSAQPLLITHYDRTCGCTTLEYDNQPLKPNEERTVKLLFDARGAWGWQLKMLTLHLGGHEQPKRIIVEAEIE